MFKKLALVFLWFLLTPLLLITSGILISKNSNNRYPINQSLPLTFDEKTKINMLSSQVLGVEITDMRPYYVANFLENTPLELYSHFIVQVSDKYGLDYRLIPAIAMKESGGGWKARTGSHNAWGFENGRTNFISWEEAIEIVGRTLKERYIAQGLTTPEAIMPVYAPPQLKTGGKWAKDINFFFSKLENL